MQGRTRLATGITGVLKCVDGVLRGATVGPVNGNINIPLLLITSTRDALDPSETAEVSKTAKTTSFISSTMLPDGNPSTARVNKVYHATF